MNFLAKNTANGEIAYEMGADNFNDFMQRFAKYLTEKTSRKVSGFMGSESSNYREMIDGHCLQGCKQYKIFVQVPERGHIVKTNLLAAAPDLLEMCKEFVFLEKTTMSKKIVKLRIAMAKDVIAKAESEGKNEHRKN